MKYKNYGYSLVMATATFLSVHAHDVILEAKGAYFLATNKTFRNIYDKGGGIYGGELTFALRNPWYGFASVDFFRKCGKTCNFCSPTKVSITSLALGVKYLMPFEHGDVYVGLGILPTHVKTKDCSPFVAPILSKWGCGGIGKIGVYFNMPDNFTFNVFYNYSFVHVGCVKPCVPTQPRRADLSGSWFGVGLGYRFGGECSY
jgi:opacity protein-like surface antigen